MNDSIDLNSTYENIGGIAYLIANLSVYLPYTVMYTMAALLGLLGNLFMSIKVVLANNPIDTIQPGLYLADLLISCFVDGWTITGVLVGRNFFDAHMGLCSFIAATCLVACITSLMNIGFLAFNRYVHICHHNLYAKIFTKRKTVVYCGITWFIGFIIDIPNLAGWGGHHYDTKTLECLWNRLASHSYSIFFPMSSIVIPCVCILLCYMRIFMFVSSAKSKVTTAANGNQRDMKKSLKLAKGLFASFMLFTICWLPYGLIVMIDFGDNFPASAHAYAMAIAHYNSSLNPVLYAVANPAFQRGYMRVFQIVFCRPQAPQVMNGKSMVNDGTRHSTLPNPSHKS